MRDHLRWIADPLDHIEHRQALIGEKIDRAIIVVRKGFTADSCTFSNVVFVCETEAIAADLASAMPTMGIGRVWVGGMSEAVNLLAFCAAKASD